VGGGGGGSGCRGLVFFFFFFLLSFGLFFRWGWGGGGGGPLEVPWVSSCRGLITGMFFVFFEQLHKIGRLQSPSANGLFLFIYLLVLAKVRGILGSP